MAVQRAEESSAIVAQTYPGSEDAILADPSLASSDIYTFSPKQSCANSLWCDSIDKVEDLPEIESHALTRIES